MMKQTSRQLRGFTLVEIMIVVLIIGILLAIALPNYAHARADSRYHAILDNLRRIDAAKEEWAMDNSKTPTDVPSLTDLVPNYIENGLSGPISGTYVPNAMDGQPTFNGLTYDQWVANCSTNVLSANCGL